MNLAIYTQGHFTKVGKHEHVPTQLEDYQELDMILSIEDGQLTVSLHGKGVSRFGRRVLIHLGIDPSTLSDDTWAYPYKSNVITSIERVTRDIKALK